MCGAQSVQIATDDDRIAAEVARFGGSVVMTSSDARNGTERCAMVLDALPTKPDLVVNLQGDALLTPPAVLDSLIDAMRSQPAMEVATPVIRCDRRLLERLRADTRAGRIGGTMAAITHDRTALYFSKSIIPHVDLDIVDPAQTPLYFHIGAYGYRPAALRAYCGWQPGQLELCEGLEQLRYLENGMAVHTVEVDTGDADLWELNNPQDIEPIEQALAARGIE